MKNSKNKVFVIDNADLLLNDNLRRYIVTDTNNQYIIIGRNPSGLFLSQDDINELESKNENGITVFRLKKLFD
ncbi:MAG: RluB protein [Eubacterium sp.]|nr:RluB protein [Eubacterium sp.]